MITSPFRTSRFPTDWAQLYALGYGECAALLESFLEDTIDASELRELYENLNKIHYDRVQELVRQQARKLQTNGPIE